MSKTFNLSVIFKLSDKITVPLKQVGKSMSRLTIPVKQIRQSVRALARDKSLKGFGIQMQLVRKSFRKAAEQIKRDLKGITKGLRTMAKTAGDKMKNIGRDLSMKLTVPLAIFAGLAVRSAISFQASMNMVGAVTKSTGKEFIELTKLAKKMGATTQFSASQAAEGMKFLGMAGLTVDQIIGALPKTLELAASAQIDLGIASDIVTNIMSGYRMETSELAKVNDVLVNAFTSSNTDLQQLGEAMKVVGPVAKAMEFRFTETAAALGILAKNAFQGTLGGTGLRRIMTNLISPSKKAKKMFLALGLEVKNADGTLKDITGVIKEFEDAQAKGVKQMYLTQAAMEMFGQRGGPQFLALIGAGSEELRKFEKNLHEVGTSAAVAEAQMKGLPGAFKLLVSAFEAVQLAIIDSGLGEFLESMVRKFAVFLQKLSEVSPNLLKFIGIIGIFVAAIPPLLIVLGALLVLIAVLTLKIAIIAGAVIAFGLAAAALIAYWKPVKEFFSDLFGFITSQIQDTIGALVGLLPDWLKKKMGLDFAIEKKEIGTSSDGAKGLIGATKAAGATGKSETDINIKLQADPGTTATIERVKKKKGDAVVNVASEAYMGVF